MEDECLGVKRDRYNLIGSGEGPAHIIWEVPYRILPARVISFTASKAVSIVFHTLAPQTKLLLADEVRYVYFRLVRIPRILVSHEIVIDVEYLICICRHNTCERPHIAQVLYLSVLLRDFTDPYVIFLLTAFLEHSTSRTASFVFTHRLSLRGALLVFVETRAASKVSFAFGEGDSNGVEGARRPSNKIAIRLVEEVCDVICTCFVQGLHTYLFAIASLIFVIT